MTRSKKSRKPGVGSSGIPKVDKKQILSPVAKKPKNKSGKKAGNRQHEGLQKNKNKPAVNTHKDPRIGNKTPIELGKVVTPQTSSSNKPAKSSAPIAAVRPIETNNTDLLEQQIEAIEQDPRLLSIIEKQENDINLTDAEIDLFNELMEKHQVISEQLGWHETDEQPVTTQEKSNSEEELWHKFDNGDLSDYQ